MTVLCALPGWRIWYECWNKIRSKLEFYNARIFDYYQWYVNTLYGFAHGPIKYSQIL